MSLRRIILLSVASSMIWGLLAYVLVGTTAGEKAIWGGLLASPFIGLLMGLTFGRMRIRPTLARAVVSLLALYVATFLFGLAVGAWDLLTGVNSGPGWRRIPEAVVLQGGLGMMWGLTFTGYLVLLWPLAYVNFWLLWREPAGRSRDGAESVPQPEVT